MVQKRKRKGKKCFDNLEEGYYYLLCLIAMVVVTTPNFD